MIWLTFLINYLAIEINSGEIMGFEEVTSVLSALKEALFSVPINVSSIFAWAGVILIMLVVSYYIVMGMVKAAKIILNMKASYFGIFTLVLGIMFLAIALLAP